jgi:hypothetical protein
MFTVAEHEEATIDTGETAEEREHLSDPMVELAPLEVGEIRRDDREEPFIVSSIRCQCIDSSSRQGMRQSAFKIGRRELIETEGIDCPGPDGFPPRNVGDLSLDNDKWSTDALFSQSHHKVNALSLD